MKIILASNNAGKLQEFQQLFTGQNIQIIPQQEFAITDAEETGCTFVENALIKARHAALQSSLPAIADDSGLVIDALNGEPGIYSARYAGEHGNAKANYEKVLHKMRTIPQVKRTAHFHCTLVYLTHAADPEPIIATAKWYGNILTAPQGDAGFGYDPIFYISEYDCSAAELAPEIKNTISHRAQALEKLVTLLKEGINTA